MEKRSCGERNHVGNEFVRVQFFCKKKKDSGNTDIQSVRQESENADKTVMKRSKSEEKEAEEILEICSKTYAKAEKEGKLDDLEMIRDLIKELGEKGFTAVDSENQVNMTEYEKLIQFSEKAEAKKNGRMTVVEVAKGGELHHSEYGDT